MMSDEVVLSCRVDDHASTVCAQRSGEAEAREKKAYCSIIAK